MGLEAVLPGPQNALYVMLCYATAWIHCAGSATYQVTDPEPEP